jgi:hypothetical protein
MAVLLLAGAVAGCDLGDREETAPTTSTRAAAMSRATEGTYDLGPLTPAVARQAVLIELRGREAPARIACQAMEGSDGMSCQLEYAKRCDQFDVIPNEDGTVSVRQPQLAVCVYTTWGGTTD